MSDYIANSEQACSSMDFSPSALGLGDPAMSDLLDNFDWDDPDYEDLAKVDWHALHGEIMEVVVGEPDEGLQPGDR
jgi:hypothetical protein